MTASRVDLAARRPSSRRVLLPGSRVRRELGRVVVLSVAGFAVHVGGCGRSGLFGARPDGVPIGVDGGAGGTGNVGGSNNVDGGFGAAGGRGAGGSGGRGGGSGGAAGGLARDGGRDLLATDGGPGDADAGDGRGGFDGSPADGGVDAGGDISGSDGGSIDGGSQCDPVRQNCGTGLRCDLIVDSGQLVFGCVRDGGGHGGQDAICTMTGQECMKGATCLQDTDRFGNPIGPPRCTVFCNSAADCPPQDRCIVTGVIGTTSSITVGLCLP